MFFHPPLMLEIVYMNGKVFFYCFHKECSFDFLMATYQRHWEESWISWRDITLKKIGHYNIFIIKIFAFIWMGKMFSFYMKTGSPNLVGKVPFIFTLPQQVPLPDRCSKAYAMYLCHWFNSPSGLWLEMVKDPRKKKT